jgi:hypothetical protein
MDDVDLRRALVQRLDVARVRDLDDAAVFAALHGSSLGGLRFHTFRLRSGGRSYLLGAIRIVELVIENLDKNVFYRNLRRSFSSLRNYN